MSCCFISFVTCPEIAGIETALHFSDCSSRSCGHRNAGCLPRLFPLLSRLPVYLSLKSSLVSSPPCLPFFLSLSLPWGDDSGSSGKSLINTETLFYFFNKNAVAFLSLSSSLLFLAFNTLLRFSKHQSDFWRVLCLAEEKRPRQDPLLYQNRWWWHTLSTLSRPYAQYGFEPSQIN